MSGPASKNVPTGFAETMAQGGAREPDESGEMPTMVDRFLIEDELGAGGMGRVYVAYDPSLDRKVAVKLLLGTVGVDKVKASARLAREARAMARLRHPNVVTVHEVGTPEGGGVFIVMELVPGGTLRDWTERDPEPSWEQTVQMYTYAGRGLAAAHDAGLVHRDFKPDNVLVGDDGRVQVTDFGIANIYGEEPHHERHSQLRVGSELTRVGTVTGTPPYMSPEQHEGKTVDARTDQFAFCAALYEALYGVRPFDGATYDEIAERAIEGRITPPMRQRGVPARIGEAISRGLRPIPDDRFRSMQALLAALAPPKRSGNPRWLAIGASVAIAVAVAIAIALATRGNAPAAEPSLAKPPGLIAVESFEVSLDSYLGRTDWREGIGDVISIVLADIDGFKTTGPTTMLGPEGLREAREKPTRPDFRAAETKAGAAYVVHGTIDEHNKRLSAQVTLVRADGTLVATLDLDRPNTELWQLLDDIAERIASTIVPGTKLPANGANRARALHAIGDEYLRANNFQMARPFLEQAASADPTFFEGWYSLLLTRSSLLAPESLVFDALEHATATAPTPVRRRLVEGMGYYLRHDLPKSQVALARLIDEPSLSKQELRDALYFLGEAHWHDGHHRVGTTYFKKTLDVDFRFKLPLQHLAEYATANRDLPMFTQYAPMFASSTRETRDSIAWLEGKYEELAREGAHPTRLYAVILLGRTPTANEEAAFATTDNIEISTYRAAQAYESNDSAAAKRELDKIWKMIEEREQAGELADNHYYVLRIIGDVVLAAGNVDQARRIVSFLAERSKQHPVRSYQRISILTAGLVGNRALIDRRELTGRDTTLADAIEAELAGDRAKAATLLEQLVKDPSPYWDFPERVALLRNLKALGRTKEARALCDDTLRPAIFRWAVLPTRRACN